MDFDSKIGMLDDSNISNRGDGSNQLSAHQGRIFICFLSGWMILTVMLQERGHFEEKVTID